MAETECLLEQPGFQFVALGFRHVAELVAFSPVAGTEQAEVLQVTPGDLGLVARVLQLVGALPSQRKSPRVARAGDLVRNDGLAPVHAVGDVNGDRRHRGLDSDSQERGSERPTLTADPANEAGAEHGLGGIDQSPVTPPAVEVLGQLRGTAVAVGRVDGQAVLEDRPQARWNRRVGRADHHASPLEPRREIGRGQRLQRDTLAPGAQFRGPAGEEFEQDHAQRVNVGAVAIGRGRSRETLRLRDQPEPFGCHVGECPADIVGHIGRLETAHRGTPSDREVEVEQHRGGLGRQQHVRRLDVAVEHPAAIREVERLGEPGHDPGRCLRIREVREQFPCRPTRAGGRELRGRDAIQVVQQVPPRGRTGLEPSPLGQYRCQGRSPQERQTEHLQRAIVDQAVPQHLDDVRVSGAGEQPRLGGDLGRDLHHHEPVVEISLLGQEDPGEPTPSQLAHEQVRTDLVPRLGLQEPLGLAWPAPESQLR